MSALSSPHPATEEQQQMLWQKASFLTRLVASSVNISEAAGELIKTILSGGDLKIVDKDLSGTSQDLQTEADRSAQFLIEKSLRAKFGESLRIVGEEDVTTEVSHLERGVSLDALRLEEQLPPELKHIREQDVIVWVDPLDGTGEFAKARQNPSLLRQVTVLIGVTHKGRPVAGVVHQPFWGGGNGNEAELSMASAGRTIYGIVGVGTWGHDEGEQYRQQLKMRREKAVEARSEEGEHDDGVSSKSPRLGVTSGSHHTRLVGETMDTLRTVGLIDRVERVGGAGYKVIRCLEGATAYVFASSGCKKWDTAAPEAILAGAGGELTDLSGRQIRYDVGVQLENSGGVLATAPGIPHKEFVNAIPQRIKDQLPEFQPTP